MWSALIAVSVAADRPNILWITAEDMSANLGCYGDGYASTPHLDAFARESVRYTRAFATAPVCSPARSTLITGCYATSLGTQRLRSAFPIPAAIKGFPEYLRRAGYFTSNNVKTDYNIADEKDFIAATWERNSGEAHWRQREDGAAPFLSVFNLMTTHQSRANVWPWEQFEKEVGSRLSKAERHDPAKAPLPPYYADTPLARRTLARYHDCITAMDKEVGELLRQLEADDLADDTIVFFYSDHGMGMPRGKRVLHDSGMHVPLMIRFPEKWRHLAPATAGQTTNRLVSFVDFAPTVLSLSGIKIPQHMQGTAFLGEQRGDARKFIIGARDRVDEVFDVSRSVRDDRWLLIHNHMPHLSWMPPERYSDNAEMRRELKRLAAAGQLNAAQMTYAAPRRAPVEFYDTWNDPHQMRNLAAEPEHAAKIARMTATLRQWQVATRDLGYHTEPELWRTIGKATPWEFGRSLSAGDYAATQAAAYETAPTAALLVRPHPARYWGVIGFHGRAGASPDGVRAELRDLLTDPNVSVRIEAAAVLASLDPAASLGVLARELQHPQVEARLRAMRALELMGADARPLIPAMEAARDEATRRMDEHPCWMFVQFSAEAALEGLRE